MPVTKTDIAAAMAIIAGINRYLGEAYSVDNPAVVSILTCVFSFAMWWLILESVRLTEDVK